MYTLLSFIVVIGIVIFVHELGHFLAAKLVGIRVERFSLGYPPRMVGKSFRGTDYCISWLPLGGYVKMAGMIDESLENPEKLTGSADEFMSKSPRQKILVVCAGVIMNMVLAMGIYSTVTLSEGVPVVHDPVVESLSPGWPAEKAGIVQGDRILTVEGKQIAEWDQLLEVIHASPDKPLLVTWDHQGETKQAEITPKREKSVVKGDIQEVGLIGILPRYTFRPAGFFEALSTGATTTWGNVVLGIKSIGMLVSGKASVKELSGPIAIAKMSGEFARGGAAALFLFIAYISINIGLLNILPIPALDGGHLAMVAFEAVTRRPLSTKVKMVVQQAGMVLLLALMVVVIWNDIGRVGLLAKLKSIF
jgi:regulator of sigma E protease